MTEPGQSGRAHEYELGHSDRELKRLRLQARLVDPITRQFFRDAGLSRGMRVLDIGSGGGDTALLAAELVGDSGEVLGVDRSPVAIAAAQERMNALGKRNISFHQNDPDAVEFGGKFDAVVGRYVLMFNQAPAGMLRSLAKLLRPGGVIVFHETDWYGVRSSPVAQMYDQCHNWIVRTFKKVGANPHMGQDLHAAFVQAGIPAPSMGLQALIEGPTDDMVYVDMIAELAISMTPVMEEQGVIARGAIDPATYSQRMRSEVKRLDSVMVGRSEIGAWSRVL
jgi:ubiquinone/menaquinone biosynthesis C-methylase UbiE